MQARIAIAEQERLTKDQFKILGRAQKQDAYDKICHMGSIY